MPGEIIVTHADGFYSYAAKYLDPNGASWQIPADIPAETAALVRRLSVEAFKALELAGMARVDFFVEPRRRRTCSSTRSTRFPASPPSRCIPRCGKRPGCRYPALLDRLIALAMERHAEKQRLRTSVTDEARAGRARCCLAAAFGSSRGCRAARRRPRAAPPAPASPSASRSPPPTTPSSTPISQRVPALLAHACGAAGTRGTSAPRGLARRLPACWTSCRAGGSSRPIRSIATRDAEFAAPRRTRPLPRPRPGPCSEPARAEAWFYVGRGLQRARAVAGPPRRSGWPPRATASASRTRSSAPSTLDPGLQDAYFGIGLYHYYADVAPVAAKMLRWLLLLPGGDREAGLREMLRARDGGAAAAERGGLPAAHPLRLVREAARGRRWRSLRRPAGDAIRTIPLFAQAAAEIEDVHLSDYAASLRSWRALRRSRPRGVAEPAEVRRGSGWPRQLDRCRNRAWRSTTAHRPGGDNRRRRRTGRAQLRRALDRWAHDEARPPTTPPGVAPAAIRSRRARARRERARSHDSAGLPALDRRLAGARARRHGRGGAGARPLARACAWRSGHALPQGAAAARAAQRRARPSTRSRR